MLDSFFAPILWDRLANNKRGTTASHRYLNYPLFSSVTLEQYTCMPNNLFVITITAVSATVSPLRMFRRFTEAIKLRNEASLPGSWFYVKNSRSEYCGSREHNNSDILGVQLFFRVFLSLSTDCLNKWSKYEYENTLGALAQLISVFRYGDIDTNTKRISRNAHVYLEVKRKWSNYRVPCPPEVHID